MKKLTSLPHPDQYGNYWFRSKQTEVAPAIFPAMHKGRRGKFFVSLGRRGVLFDGPDILLFEDPQQAIKAIQERFGIAV